MIHHSEPSCGNQTAAEASISDAAQIDWRTVLADIGDDEALLRELVGVFITSGPEMLGDVRQALQQRDMRMVARAAHKFAGAVGNFGRGPAYFAARALEETAVAGREDETEPAFASVEREFAGLAQRLHAYLGNPCV